jgi:hypothetical protein
MDKENVVYTYSRILYSFKEKEILSHLAIWLFVGIGFELRASCLLGRCCTA